MDYFLQVFGEVTVGRAVAVVAAAVFLLAVYKKVEKYFADKAVREKEKEDQLNGTIGELGEKLDEVNRAIGELRQENSEDRATTCRYRILRVDDEIRHDERHSKEHFDQILEDITEYEKYCSSHPDYKNNKALLAIRNIKRIYQKCTDEGTFL